MTQPQDDPYLDAAIDDTYVEADQHTGRADSPEAWLLNLTGQLGDLATTAAAGASRADLYLAAIQLGGLAAGFAAELSRAEASEPVAARAA